MERREFLAAGVALSAAGSLRRFTPLLPATQPSGTIVTAAAQRLALDPLDDLTIATAQAEIAAGRLTSRALTEHYLRRIRTLDADGPRVNAVIEANPDALAQADAADANPGGRALHPLHGMPILLKDNIDTADRMSTSAGSLALAEHRARRDAGVVALLRASGAVILGKTNLSEWANFRSNRSSSGWSGRGGQTRNPHVLDRSPCGSSSGSGAAVAADFCIAAVGTETDGSVVCPSSLNGIVGLKPTVGLVSRSGIIPISASQDTAGPMARTVRDAALLLNGMIGRDPADAATRTAPAALPADYTRTLDVDGLRGMRIGIARNYFGFDVRVDALMEDAIRVMRDRGAVIVDNANVPNADKYGREEFEVLLHEFKAGLNAYLGALPAADPVHSLAELILWNERNDEAELQWFGQETFTLAQKRGSLGSRVYRTARETCVRLSRREGIDAVLRRTRCDLLVGPTGGPAWMIDLVTGDHFGGGVSTAPAVAGYPHLTVPAGRVAGLPVGISFFGAAWSEPQLFRAGFAFEQATTHRVRPAFLPTITATPR
ncbi:MAG: amidase [Gemmatimonadaceae bacterium]|nr:amidase [Gemmatimonadaceae bacterium]